jgi:hypothetical protein
MMLSSLEALRRAREEVCSGCGWGRVLAERWECINPNCLSPDIGSKKSNIRRLTVAAQ